MSVGTDKVRHQPVHNHMRFLVVVAGVLLLGAALWLTRLPALTPLKPSPTPPATNSAPPAPPPPATPAAPADKAPEPRPDVKALLDALIKALRDGDDEAARKILGQLKAGALPPDVPDAENAALVYARAFEVLEGVKLDETERRVYNLALQGDELSPADTETLRAILAKHADGLKLLRDAARMPSCRFPIEYDMGFAALLPHVGPMIKCGKLLRMEADLARRDGRLIEADVALTAMGMTRAIRTDAILVSQLVGNVVDGIAQADLMRALDGAAPDIVARLSGLDPSSVRRDTQRSFVIEITAVVDLFLNGDKHGALDPEWRAFMQDPMRRHDCAFYLENMSQMITLLDRPFGEVRQDFADAEKRIEAAPWYAQGTKLVMPALSRAAEHMAVSESMMQKARLAVALKQYRATHGVYPASLDVLGGAPKDALTGEAFQYRLEGGGFVIESLGNPDRIWRSEK